MLQFQYWCWEKLRSQEIAPFTLRDLWIRGPQNVSNLKRVIHICHRLLEKICMPWQRIEPGTLQSKVLHSTTSLQKLACTARQYKCMIYLTNTLQSVEHLTRKSGVLGSIPGLAIYFRFSFRFFKNGSCQLLAKVCARSTG